jgi:peptidoglycan/xylan/chitin deacetylase (PgdA/CDA1 family)
MESPPAHDSLRGVGTPISEGPRMDVDGAIRTVSVRACLAAAMAASFTLAGLDHVRAGSEAEWSLRVPVLLYHHVAAPPRREPRRDHWVSPARFRSQLRALRDDGWTAMTAGQLAMALREGTPIGPRRFVVTIDDGARDGLSNAAPILDELGMRATYCVVPGWARRPGQLTPHQMRRLALAGHEIADHSLSHRDLRDLGAPGLRREVAGAQRLILRYVGREARTFCFPLGAHDAAARRIVAASGHLIAFTATEGVRHSPSRALRSPRIVVRGSDTPRELLERIAPTSIEG